MAAQWHRSSARSVSRVATRSQLVLPNGPESASIFLGVSSAAACAPLNPAYTPAELDFYLGDLDAKLDKAMLDRT